MGSPGTQQLRRNRRVSLQQLPVELIAVGQKGAPDTYGVAGPSPHSAVNVGTDWLLVSTQGQTTCYGIIQGIRALTYDTIEYIVKCVAPPTYLFLVVDRCRTSNPSGVTKSFRQLKPHLRDTQQSPITHPWAAPGDQTDRVGGTPSRGPPLEHHRVEARCISLSESDLNPSTWKVVHVREKIRVGMFLDLHDADDSHMPVGPVRVVGVCNVERNWAEFSAQIHPHFNRTNATQILIAVPIDHSSLPPNLGYIHSTTRHLLPDVLGNKDIFPHQPPQKLIHRIKRVFTDSHA